MSHLQWPLGHVGLRECNLNNNKIPASKALSKFPAKNRPQKFRNDVQPISWYLRQQIDMILCCNDKKKTLILPTICKCYTYKFGLFRGSLETRNYIETAVTVDVLDFFCAFPSSHGDPFCPLLRLQNQKGVGGQKSIGQDHHLSIGVFSQVRGEGEVKHVLKNLQIQKNQIFISWNATQAMNGLDEISWLLYRFVQHPKKIQICFDTLNNNAISMKKLGKARWNRGSTNFSLVSALADSAS